MKILMKGKVETVSLDRVLNLHTSSLKQVHQQSMIRNRKRQIQKRLGSFVGPERTKQNPLVYITLAQKSHRTRVKSKTNTQTQSAATKIGRSPAITPQHQAYRVNLPTQLTPYIAPRRFLR